VSAAHDGNTVWFTREVAKYAEVYADAFNRAAYAVRGWDGKVPPETRRDVDEMVEHFRRWYARAFEANANPAQVAKVMTYRWWQHLSRRR